MITINNTYIIQKHITAKELDGILYLLDPQKGHLHTLNDTARIVWNHIAQKKTSNIIIQALVNEYHVSEKIATQDVFEILKSWIKLGVITQQKSSKSSSTPKQLKR